MKTEKLIKVNPYPYFTVVCLKCSKVLHSKHDVIYADLNGKPFKAYYCYDHINKNG